MVAQDTLAQIRVLCAGGKRGFRAMIGVGNCAGESVGKRPSPPNAGRRKKGRNLHRSCQEPRLTPTIGPAAQQVGGKRISGNQALSLFWLINMGGRRQSIREGPTNHVGKPLSPPPATAETTQTHVQSSQPFFCPASACAASPMHQVPTSAAVAPLVRLQGRLQR